MLDRCGYDRRELAVEFRAVAEGLSRTTDVDATLHRIVGLAATTVPGCDEASITAVGPQHRFQTLAATARPARTVDELQFLLREGPCVAAIAKDGLFLADDLTESITWPEFSVRAVAVTPIRTALSLTVSPDTPRAALNLYGRCPGTFTADSVRMAEVFAAHTRVLMLYARATEKVINLDRALTTSRLIGAAVGILASTQRITTEEALTLLKTRSQRLNRKMVDLAEQITRTGELPHPASPDASTSRPTRRPSLRPGRSNAPVGDQPTPKAGTR